MYLINKRLYESFSWVFFERICQIVVAFAVSGIVSRQLGVGAYGDFQYVLSLILIFSSVGFLSSSEILLPKISTANLTNVNHLIITGFLIRFGAALVAYLILIFYAYIFEKNQGIFGLLSFIGLTLLLREPFAVYTIYFQSRNNYKPIVLASILVSINKVLILVVLYWFNLIGYGLLGIVWFLEALVLGLIYRLLYLREMNNLSAPFKFSQQDIEKIIREGFLYVFPLALTVFFLKLDRILVRNFSSDYEAGVYMAGMQLFDASVSVAAITSIVLAPTLIYQKDSKIEIRKNMKNMLLIMFLLGCSISILGYFLTPYAIGAVFGANFFDSILIAQIAFFISILVFIDSALNVYLIKQRDYRFALIKWIIVLVIALPVEFFSIVHLGAQAAQIGIVAGYISAIFLGAYKLWGGCESDVE